MCGICGYKVLKDGSVTDAINVFEAILLESEIRGKHATGVSWLWNNKLQITKQGIPAKQFVESDAWEHVKLSQPYAMIGHTRYSTSGEEHQPIELHGTAIAHNGLVSMATRDQFDKLYGVDTVTDNDSEIILQKIEEACEYEGMEASWNDSLATALKSIYKVDTPIFALAFLNEQGEVKIVRDHVRPLWLFYIKEWNIMGFASTKDILMRAFKKFKDMPEHAIWKTDAYKIYKLGAKIGDGEDILQYLGDDVQMGEYYSRVTRYNAKPLVDKPFLSNKLATLSGTDLRLDNPKYAEGDHRLNLRESFKRYCAASIKTWEIDANYPLVQYIFERYELSESQQYWACFLYGVFYHPGTVFYVMQEFPEFEKVDLERLTAWHTANWKQLRYNKDRKYEKGHFVEMFQSYVSVIGGQTPGSQSTFFEKHFTSTPYENFHKLWRSLAHLLRFGRYSLYIYTETLARCMGVPIEANTLFLKDSNSPRAGLCYVVGKPEWAKAKLSNEDWSYLELEVNRLISEVRQEYSTVPMDFWFMESCLCAYKGFFANGRYLGYYIDRMADEILQMSDIEITSGVDWKVLWQFRRENLPWEYLGEYAKPPRLKVQAQWRHVLVETGHMIGMAPVIKRGLLPNTKVSK